MTDPGKTDGALPRRAMLRAFRIGPSTGALSDFYYQLATLLRAGLSALRALDTLREQTRSRAVRRRIPAMLQHITDGGNVGSAFALFPDVFDPIHVAIIRAGEQGGRLSETLDLLAATTKRRARLVKVFIGLILYPVLLLHLALLALPIVHRLVQALNQEPQTPYLALLLPRLALLYGALFAVLLVPRVMRQFPSAAYALDRLKTFIPVWSGIAEKLALARLARALGGLVDSGVTLLEALPVAADTCGNEVLRRRMHALAPEVRLGRPMSAAMIAAGGFPRALVNLVATGEEGGQLADVLRRAADYYDDEAETALKRVIVVLPIIVFLVVAVYIGYQIIRAYMTIFTQTLGERPR